MIRMCGSLPSRSSAMAEELALNVPMRRFSDCAMVRSQLVKKCLNKLMKLGYVSSLPCAPLSSSYSGNGIFRRKNRPTPPVHAAGYD